MQKFPVMSTASRPPRLLYATDTYPPQLNGVSVVTALSVEGMRRRGWIVDVIAPRYPPVPDDVFVSGGDPAASVIALPSTAFPLYPDIRLAAPAWRDIDEVIATFVPDVVHCATEFMIGRLAQRAARKRDLPVVSSYHTDFSRYTVAYGVPWLERPVQRYLARFHRRSRRVFTPGESAAAELRAFGVTDVEVWGRGVDVATFRPERRDPALRRAYAGDDAFLLLHVGRLAPEKGVERILAGFARARERLAGGRPIRLVIAGSGPRESVLRASASEGVTFLGNLDRSTVLPRLYASADAFVFASHTETLGLVLLEAMASGLPVIAAPVGGVADHLRSGINGLAYPPGDTEAMADAIVRLATSAGDLRALGEGARRTATERSWELELDRLAASYDEVCSSAMAA